MTRRDNIDVDRVENSILQYYDGASENNFSFTLGALQIAKYIGLSIPGFPHEVASELASQVITTVLHTLTTNSARVYGDLLHAWLDIATLLPDPNNFGL